MHLHINPIGGLAGDMFCAALLDARPDLFPLLQDALTALSPPAGLRVFLEEASGQIAGKRFTVGLPDRPGTAHRHTRYRDIKRLVEQSLLSDGVRHRALTIFHLMAEAEAKVHGVATEEVRFHELGNWDSIVDVVAASFLLEQLDVTSVSTGPLPMGRGTVQTAHGPLPVPAPATALLLQGLPIFDDGVGGERVTPTGAAILKSLDPHPAPRTVFRMGNTGYGFGTRELTALPNCVQALLQEEPLGLSDEDPAGSERIGELVFEVDDQSPEDLATGLDRLRDLEGVLSVTTLQGIGKGGRPLMQIQVLSQLTRVQQVAAACFRETTTIGLRWRATDRWRLRRDSARIQIEGDDFQVKRVVRPDGVTTAKAEQRSLSRADGQAERARLRRLAEQAALDQNDADESNDA